MQKVTLSDFFALKGCVLSKIPPAGITPFKLIASSILGETHFPHIVPSLCAVMREMMKTLDVIERILVEFGEFNIPKFGRLR